MTDSELIRWPEALRMRLPQLMRSAIYTARRGHSPFGCVIADWKTGSELVQAANSSELDPTAHAEINGIREATRRGLHLADLLLISTAEPCPMCSAACWWAGLRGVVYGTSIKSLIGYGLQQLDMPADQVFATAVNRASPWILRGYLASETDELYKRLQEIRKFEVGDNRPLARGEADD